MPKQFFFSAEDIRQKEHGDKPKPRPKSRGTKKSTKIYDCSTCGLDKQCRNAKMSRDGDGGKDIMFIGNVPDLSGDAADKPFGKEVERQIATALRNCGYNLYKDCTMTNVVRCRTPKGKYGRVRYPNGNEIKSCARFLQKDIEEAKPKLIICLGDTAIVSMLKTKAFGDIRDLDDKVHGLVFPSHVYNAWIACSFHPGDTDRRVDRTDAFNRDLQNILGYLDKPLPQPLTNEGNYEVTTIKDAMELLEAFSKSEKPVAFDYECTCISPYDEKAELISVNLSDNPDEAYVIHVSNPNWSNDDHGWFREAMQEFLTSPAPKIVQNYYMEELWSREHIGVGMNNMIMDTMVTSHVLNCRRGTTSLDFQAFRMTGHYYSDLVDKKNMIEVPLPLLCEYGG